MVDYSVPRRAMVNGQLRPNKVTDPRLLAAMGQVAKERFVAERLRGVAYVDSDLEIAPGRRIMEPRVLGRLLQEAAVNANDVALDIGGGGYSAAILSSLATTVVALECDPEIAAAAEALMVELEADNVVTLTGDLAAGAPDHGPFDVILVCGAVADVPEAISDQLADGGRLVTVLVAPDGVGRAILMLRRHGTVSSRVLFEAFAPPLPGFERAPQFSL